MGAALVASGTVPFAAAMSEHPLTAHAAGEVAGALLEQVGERPDLVLVFVSPHHAGALEDVAGALDAVLHPLVLLGAAAESVIGPHREVEHAAAISALAARVGPVVPLALDVVPGDGGAMVTGWPPVPFTPSAALLVADPYSVPPDAFVAWLAAHHGALPVVGGFAGAARGPGGNRLVLGHQVRSAGAVGVLLGPGVEVETVVSQGCRPFGRPFVVTRAEGTVISELAGRPALERLVAQASTLPPDDVAVIEHGGLHLGRVIDEHRASFGPGDFLVRTVVGVDRASGALVVGDVVPVGTTVQFHLRDARSADDDLHLQLRGRRADAAVLFTCNGRGSRFFGRPDHDVGVIAEQLGTRPVVGCFAAGELGPVGGRTFLHGFTAALALLRDRPAPSA